MDGPITYFQLGLSLAQLSPSLFGFFFVEDKLSLKYDFVWAYCWNFIISSHMTNRFKAQNCFWCTLTERNNFAFDYLALSWLERTSHFRLPASWIVNLVTMPASPISGLAQIIGLAWQYTYIRCMGSFCGKSVDKGKKQNRNCFTLLVGL